MPVPHPTSSTRRPGATPAASLKSKTDPRARTMLCCQSSSRSSIRSSSLRPAAAARTGAVNSRPMVATASTRLRAPGESRSRRAVITACTVGVSVIGLRDALPYPARTASTTNSRLPSVSAHSRVAVARRARSPAARTPHRAPGDSTRPDRRRRRWAPPSPRRRVSGPAGAGAAPPRRARRGRNSPARTATSRSRAPGRSAGRLVRPAVHHRVAVRGDPPGQLLDQPGLADARLALPHSRRARPSTASRHARVAARHSCDRPARAGPVRSTQAGCRSCSASAVVEGSGSTPSSPASLAARRS